LEIYDTMRTVLPDASQVGTGYAPVFEAILALHRGDLDGAVAAVADEPVTLTTSHAALWRQWYAAVRAESFVLAKASDRSDVLRSARGLAEGNPIATAIVQRAEGLESGDAAALAAAATALADAGSPYQQARTLVLLGGDARAEGEALLARLGTVPMVG
jgi:hypothetical protein